MGGGGAGRTVYAPLKISLGNQYLKILDLTKHFTADAPMKKNNAVLLPLRALPNMGPKTALAERVKIPVEKHKSHI